MTYFVDFTQPEIAERLDVPHGTVKARPGRGFRGLGRVLQAAEASAPR